MILLEIPTEVVVQILSHLDYRNLLNCGLVCRLFRTIVQENAAFQYTIELAVSGMQNGPPSAVCHADRLAKLRNSQAAWHNLQWTALKDVRMSNGSLYELYGGVLVQSTHVGGSGLVFRCLPSHYRGIQEHVWSLELDFVIRDFTLDPAQDLLVLIAQPIARTRTRDARIEVSIHLRSLSTGKVHPLATEPPVLVHDVDRRTATLSFMIQIHRDRVAVHFVSRAGAPSELVVWNWKTGGTVLSTYSVGLLAFAFLTERLILVGGFRGVGPDQSPRLTVVDLDSGQSERTEFDRVEYLCSFLYPTCSSSVQILGLLIRSDPCTDWVPHASAQVPFSIGSGPRLYIVTVWAMQDGDLTPIDMFVLSDTLLEHIGALKEGEMQHDFEWSEWGPDGTRMMAQAPHSHTWVCYVFGTRFSAIATWREEKVLEVWDFNELGIKRGIEGGSCEVERHVGDAAVLRSEVFSEEVETRLPYRVFRRKVDGDGDGDGEGLFTEAMCSEDGVILVNSHARLFRIMTF